MATTTRTTRGAQVTRLPDVVIPADQAEPTEDATVSVSVIPNELSDDLALRADDLGKELARVDALLQEASEVNESTWWAIGRLMVDAHNKYGVQAVWVRDRVMARLTLSRSRNVASAQISQAEKAVRAFPSESDRIEGAPYSAHRAIAPKLMDMTPAKRAATVAAIREAVTAKPIEERTGPVVSAAAHKAAPGTFKDPATRNTPKPDTTTTKDKPADGKSALEHPASLLAAVGQSSESLDLGNQVKMLGQLAHAVFVKRDAVTRDQLVTLAAVQDTLAAIFAGAGSAPAAMSEEEVQAAVAAMTTDS